MQEIIAAMLVLALAGDPGAERLFEQHEETCLGMDGSEYQAEAEAYGWCKYFE